MPHDLNDAAPSSLAHIVGQQGVTNQLRVALDAAFEDHKRLDDCLLVGPPGLGKSQIASVIGQIGDEDTRGVGAVRRLRRRLEHVAARRERQGSGVHRRGARAPEDVPDRPLPRIGQAQIVVKGGKSFQSIPLADFTLLLGTTDEFCLLQPLRDRMRLLLRFEFYTTEELTKIVVHRAKSLKWEIDESLPPLIARRARGTPRLALRLLQACRRVCRAEGERTLSLHHLRKACRPGTPGRSRSRSDGAEVPENPGGRNDPPERHRLDVGVAGADFEHGDRTVPDPGGTGGEGRHGAAAAHRHGVGTPGEVVSDRRPTSVKLMSGKHQLVSGSCSLGVRFMREPKRSSSVKAASG